MPQIDVEKVSERSKDGDDSEQRQSTHVGTGVYTRPRRSLLRQARIPVIALVLVSVVAVAIRFIADSQGLSDTLSAHVENQQPEIIDLRTAVARSPYVFGVNVFPATGTVSADNVSGFMPYDATTVAGLRSMGTTMLRFPGGSWGEEHTLSYNQIDAFLRLSQETHAQPLIQARLAGGTPQEAAALVSYTNLLNDPVRKARPNAPFVPVHYWVIGNEPDLIGPSYTVADYVRDFIAYASAMKAVDPTIQILGPEISQYSGPASPPLDATGAPWLEGFLQGVGAYERAHNVQLLDGVSIHHYPFGSSLGSTGLLFSSSEEWRYLIPLMRQQMQRTLGHDLPIAVTEINASVPGGQQASPMATALWWADSLGTLLEQRVAYVDFFALRSLDQPHSMLTSSGQPTPLARVMDLYRHMEPDVIPLGAASGPVSVYASTNAAHTTISLLLINKSSSDASLSLQPQQWYSRWHSAHVTVPAYGVVCAVINRSGGGVSYLYAPTPQMLSAGNPGIIVKSALG